MLHISISEGIMKADPLAVADLISVQGGKNTQKREKSQNHHLTP